MSDSFIHEFILKTHPHEKKVLDRDLEFARWLYNAVLQEGFKRLNLIKQSKLFQKVKKTKDYSYYRKADKFYKFSDYELQKFAIKTKNNCSIKEHLNTHICQKLATKAYISLNEYRRKKRGKPRYKKINRLKSFEGKSNETAIRFKDNKVHYKNLKLDIILDKKDKHKIQNHALSSKIKYLRLIKRKIKNKQIWFVQLILEGSPYIKEKNISQNEIIGIDIGPSTIAAYQDTHSFLDSFCSSLDPLHLNQKKLQRKLDRSLIALNPNNYNNDKTIKKKKLTWIKSNKYKKNQNKLFEVYRKLKVQRKRLHNKLANKIIRLANVIRLEKLSYKAFQKRYGRSVSHRAPSMFIQILKNKAENAGGRVEEINTYKTHLSQICHNCLRKEKKESKQRWHNCKCGINIQRDLYSAFLARFVENNILNIQECQKHFSGAKLLLEQAILRLNESAIGKQRLSSFGLKPKSERFAC